MSSTATDGAPDHQATAVQYGPPTRPVRGPGRAMRFLASPVGALVPVLAVLALWQVGGAIGLINETFFPVPSRIAVALWDLIRSGNIGSNLLVTAERVIGGFLLGVIPAVVVGIVMARVRWVGVLVDPLIAATYPIPVIAILPLLLVIFGTGSTPIIVLAGIISFYPAVVNTLAGVRQVDERLVLMAQNMGASGRQALWKIVLPGALPSIFAGVRLAAGLALLGAVAGEFLAASTGIGSMTWQYWQVYQISNMYATLVVIAAFGFVITVTMLRVQRRYFGWSSGE